MIPKPKKEAKEFNEFGNSRTDNYYWMNQRDTKEVINHLEAENKYCDFVMDKYKLLEDEIYNEIVARVVENEDSVPYKYKSYEYFYRYEKDKEYPIYFRKKDNKEELLLDVNIEAEKYEFLEIAGKNISPNEKLYAYGMDVTGRRLYNIIIKNLATGEIIDDNISSTTGWVVWRKDNASYFYVEQDETLRDSAIYLHKIGEPQEQDIKVFYEKDDEFTCSVFKSRDEDLIFIKSESTLSTEYRYIENSDCIDDTCTFKVIFPREKNHEYHLDYYNGEFFCLTNRDALNFKLVTFSKNDYSTITTLIEHSQEVLLEDFEIFEKYIVTNDRYNGNLILSVYNRDTHTKEMIIEPEDVYTAELSINPDAKSTIVRYSYTSFTTPETVVDYNFITKERTIIKESEVKGDFSKDNYVSERIFVIGEDGVEVPISIVKRKDLDSSKANPLMLYGYGSYGISSDPYFSIARLSLLDRGFIYAIAHIRGGEEKGRGWYEDGKLSRKMNTFKDFILCGRELVKQGYTQEEKLFAYGGSAGGLLMGAVINMAPLLFKGVLAAVPFVDVLTTMLDDSIPLTTGEYDEWGNPNIEADYNTMKEYSPYDNIAENAYPNLLVTTGYNDSQVQYWEPAKWVAKLRDYNISDNKIIFKTDMTSGHSGPSGRYAKYREIAFDYCFMISLL